VVTKPVIAIDVDDVLAQHAESFIEYSNQKWGTSLTLDDYDEHWAKVWQVDIAEALRRRDEFVSSKVHDNFIAHTDSDTALKSLAERFELRIVTSRLLSMKEGTLEWIKQTYPGVFSEDHIHFAGIWDKLESNSHAMTKTDVLKQIGASYLIDDQLKHCYAASEAGVQAILFGNYGWNQVSDLPKDITRCRDWAAILEYFHDK